jgi:cytochrome P450
MSLQLAEDPYPVYEQVRSRGELVASRLGIHLTASHSLCRAILRDQRVGVAPISKLTRINFDRRAGSERLVQPVDDSFLSLNPPKHTMLRQLVLPWFTPRALRARTPVIQEVVGRHLDELAGRERFDAISDFAVRVAIETISDLLGVESCDQERFVWWGTTLAGTLNGVRTMDEVREVRTVLGELETFIGDLMTYRRSHPGDDIVSSLVDAEVDGVPVEKNDLLATAELLFLAGFETMVNLVGSSILLLLGDDAARGFLHANPDRAQDVIEEVLRVESPVQYVARVTREPMTIAGHDLPADSTIVLLIGGANRDPAVFGEPDRFDPTRENSAEHLGFSAGAHFCLGASLARIQGTALVRGLFERFPDLVRAGPIRRRPARNIRGVINLPVSPVPARTASGHVA